MTTRLRHMTSQELVNELRNLARNIQLARSNNETTRANRMVASLGKVTAELKYIRHPQITQSYHAKLAELGKDYSMGGSVELLISFIPDVV